jgi:hypothetical protein
MRRSVNPCQRENGDELKRIIYCEPGNAVVAYTVRRYVLNATSQLPSLKDANKGMDEFEGE